MAERLSWRAVIDKEYTEMGGQSCNMAATSSPRPVCHCASLGIWNQKVVFLNLREFLIPGDHVLVISKLLVHLIVVHYDLTVNSWLFFKFDILYHRYNFRIRMSIPFKTFQNLRTYSLSYTVGIQYESWTMLTKSCSNVIVQNSQSIRSRDLDMKFQTLVHAFKGVRYDLKPGFSQNRLFPVSRILWIMFIFWIKFSVINSRPLETSQDNTFWVKLFQCAYWMK